MFNLPTYDPRAVQPMRDELKAVGFTEVFTIDELEEYLKKEDETVLVVLNSVCGCSAGCLRPGVSAALQNELIPDHIITLFAGQEKDAVAHLRDNYLKGFESSSPNIILFKNGDIIKFLERHHIQEFTPETLSDATAALFNEHCTSKGPSIPASDYDNLKFTVKCGSGVKRMS